MKIVLKFIKRYLELKHEKAKQRNEDKIKEIAFAFKIPESILYKAKRPRPITRNKRKHIKPNEHRTNQSS